MSNSVTKDDAREVIDSVIIENGERGITAHSLAGVLHTMVDAAGSSDGGSLVLHLSLLDQNTMMFGSEANEVNAKVFQTIMESSESYYNIKAVFDLTQSLGFSPICEIDMYVRVPDMNIVGFMCSSMESFLFSKIRPILFTLSEDGSIMIDEGGE